jgi:hypothetical protein
MKIFNVNIYGLNESIVASGYPMKLEIGEMLVRPSEFDKDIKRSENLGNAEQGSGHDNFLKGIKVQFDLQAPEYFWRQFDRYHFHDYVSSQSKMHCIVKMNITKMCNKYVDKRVIDILNEKIEIYNQNPNQENFQHAISNCPMGFELTARIDSSYLQEKSIFYQRKNHKLEEWKYYCNWLKTLPSFETLCLKKYKEIK